MTDKQTILLKTGQTALAVDAAKAAVEAARHALEQAKADLDAAKAGFDTALEECETAGIPKAKARKAVEALNQVWIEAGIIDVSEPAPEQTHVASDADRVTRKKRRGKGEQAAEPAAEQQSQPEAASEEAAAPVPQALEPVIPEPDTGELEALIDEALSGYAPELADRYAAASALLKSLLAARAWTAARSEEAGIDAESFRAALKMASAEALAADPSLPASHAAPLSASLADKELAERVLSWFAAYLTAIENGAMDIDEPLFALPELEPVAAVEENKSREAVEVPAASEKAVEPKQPEELTAEAVVGEADEYGASGDHIDDDGLPDLPDFDDGYEPEAEENAPDDDSSFPIEDDHHLYAEEDAAVVGDIGEINFLDEGHGPEADAAEAPATIEPDKAAAPASPASKPQMPPRPTFAPPAFLKSK